MSISSTKTSSYISTAFDAFTSFSVCAQIIAAQKMSMFAMCFRFIKRTKTKTSKCINTWQNGFEMIWVYAISYATQVVDCQAFWDSTKSKFVRKSMSASIFPVSFKTTITVFIFPADPKPARISFFNSDPKSFFSGWLHKTDISAVNRYFEPIWGLN